MILDNFTDNQFLTHAHLRYFQTGRVSKSPLPVKVNPLQCPLQPSVQLSAWINLIRCLLFLEKILQIACRFQSHRGPGFHSSGTRMRS